MRGLTLIVAALIAVSISSTAFALEKEGVLVTSPELVVTRQGLNETVALPAMVYHDFTVSAEQASFTIEGNVLPEGSKRIVGGNISRVTWTPQADGVTNVLIEFATPPISSLINAVEGTKDRPSTPQVLAGFSFSADQEDKDRAFPVLGSYGKSKNQSKDDAAGNYDLPELKPVKYSDALVTLQVNGVDFRDVLWFLSEVGNVSIMLDPYWADEPTGNPRPVGAGADAGAGGDGGGEPGFRGAGGFVPGDIRQGTGDLSLNFENVPFDQALELVVMAAGLVMVEIQPAA